jgi:RNA polymerase sigma factor (TIGR02999 family)
VNSATASSNSVNDQSVELTSDELFPLVYDHLRVLARQYLQCQTPGQTLDATGLVHEAWLKLKKSGSSMDWKSRRHFYSVTTAVMRQILVDRVRRRQAIRHGGAMQRHAVGDWIAGEDSNLGDMLILDAALQRLAKELPDLAEIVQLRFFAALTYEEIAELLQCSVASIRRQWTLARTLLHSWVSN